MTKRFILGLILVIRCASASTHLNSETFLKYPEKDPRLSIRLVIGPGLESEAQKLSEITLFSLKKVEDLFGMTFRDDISIVFDNRPDFHNGLTTVVPTNRVYVHTEAPNIESSIGLVKHPLLETTIHELAHMAILQQRRGVFTPLSWIFGNLSRPLTLYPRWMHEGIAVWAESDVGGRGKLGIIDADLKKYSDYYQREQKKPLHTDFMDGSLELQSVSPGAVPYHFGYLLIQDLLDNLSPEQRGKTFKNASGNLGWFFHKTYRYNDKVVSDRFEDLSSKWAHYLPKDNSKVNEVSSQKNIKGPFKSMGGISWIESKDQSLVFKFQGKNTKESFETNFHQRGISTQQALWTGTHWVVLAYMMDLNTNKETEKKLLLANKDGSIDCSFSQVKRTREIALDLQNSNTIAWIRSQSDTRFVFEKAKYNSHCELNERTHLYATPQKFQRLSNPWLSGKKWMLSESLGSDMSRDFIRTSEGEVIKDPSGALGDAQRISIPRCENCIVATLYSPRYRGPVLFNPQNKNRLAFDIRTEAQSTVVLDSKLYTKEVLWEKDRIREFDMSAAQGITTLNKTISDTVVPESNQGKEIESYGAWPTIWPHFWYPNIQSYDRGYNISGSTFFSDLSNNWLGEATAGFDTGANRPFGNLSITKNSLGSGMLDQWSFEGASLFRYVSKIVQDNIVLATQFRISQKISPRLVMAVLPGAEYRYGSRANVLQPYSVGAPTLGFLLSSPHAVNVRLGSYQISNFDNAFYLFAKTRWLPESSTEVFSNFQGRIGNVGFLIGGEYARASEASFPKMFYEWGGRSSFSTLDTGFLARGYKSGIGPNLEIIRGNAEFGFKLWKFHRGLAWNRAHIKDIEFKPLYEVVTSNLYGVDSNGKPVKSSIRVGNDYFQTVGAELDVFFQVLHYLDFKASFGVYNGLDKGGETQYGLKLVSLLDF